MLPQDSFTEYGRDIISRDGSLATTFPQGYIDDAGLCLSERYASSFDRVEACRLRIYIGQPGRGAEAILVRRVGDLLGITVPAGVRRLDGIQADDLHNFFGDVEEQVVDLDFQTAESERAPAVTT